VSVGEYADEVNYICGGLFSWLIQQFSTRKYFAFIEHRPAGVYEKAFFYV
jgi:hypothetical protein